jgi:hypothetical protein
LRSLLGCISPRRILNRSMSYRAQNDSLALGARRAMEEANNGTDGGPQIASALSRRHGLPRTGKPGFDKGILAATIIVPPTTSHALHALVVVLENRGKQPERMLVVPESFPAPGALVSRFATLTTIGRSTQESQLTIPG